MFDWLYSLVGYDPANAEAGAKAEAQLQQTANADYAPGGKTYNQIASTQGTAAADAAYQTVKDDFANQGSVAGASIIPAAAGGAFEIFYDPAQAAKDIKDQASALGGGVGTGLAGFLNTFFGGLFNFVAGILKKIPWWVWIGVAVGLFFYFGGWKYLKRKAGRS